MSENEDVTSGYDDSCTVAKNLAYNLRLYERQEMTGFSFSAINPLLPAMMYPRLCSSDRKHLKYDTAGIGSLIRGPLSCCRPEESVLSFIEGEHSFPFDGIGAGRLVD